MVVLPEKFIKLSCHMEMMRRTSLLIIIIFTLAQQAFSQNVSDYSDYGTKYKDKDIVFLKVKTEISVDIVKTGLKIEVSKYEETFYNNYKAGAFSDTKIESSQFSKLKEIEASTLLPDNNKFNEIKVKDFKTKEVFDDHIFYQDLYATSFVYPSLRQGAITKLKYTLDISEPHFFPFEIISRYYPIEDFEFTINSDKNVVFETKYFNTDSTNLEFQKTEKGNRMICTWKAKNVKSYKQESRSPDYLCYLPQIVPYIKSYKFNNTDVNVFRNADDLFKWNNSHISKVKHLHTEAMISTVNSLVKDGYSDMEKVIAIYKWVQNNIKYVAYEYGLDGYIPRDPDVIFEKRYGDCKDMTAILVELLDIAGVKVFYTWVGTRDLPYSYAEVPTTMVSNHMIATYKENGHYYFLDGTDTYLPISLPSWAIQGKEAMIRLSDDAYEIYKIPETPSDTSVHSDFLNLTIDEGKIIGKGNVQLTGYYFSNMKQNTEQIIDAAEKEKFMKSYLETGNNKCMINKYEIVNSPNQLLVNYEFSLSDHLVINNNEMYINLNLSQPYRDFELFKDDRQLDYEFYFKSLLKSNYSFKVPDGYEVNYLPKNSTFDGSDFSYSISYEIKGDTIMYHFSMKTNVLLLKPSSFPTWNKMIKQMRSDYKEVVVLKKKI